MTSKEFTDACNRDIQAFMKPKRATMEIDLDKLNKGMVEYYRKLAHQCGWWAISRCMRNRGYSIEQVKQVLKGQ